MSAAPRRFRAPVVARVQDPEVDRILRNLDLRIRELVLEVQKLRRQVDELL